MLSIFMKKLTVNEAKNKVTTSDNAVLIDCRPKEDYAHGHVAVSYTHLKEISL